MADFLISVVGRVDCKGFQQCRVVAEHLAQMRDEVDAEAESFLESDWEEFVRAKARELGGDAFGHKLSPLVYVHDGSVGGTQYVGLTEDFLAWAKAMFGFVDRTNTVLYQRTANRALAERLAATGLTYCFLDVAVGREAPNRVLLELRTDVCPRTCENFRALCTGERGVSKSGVTLHYLGTPFHRVVRDGWVQGGDTDEGRGDGGESIYGPTFPDESFALRHDAAGVVSMAGGDGGVHSNASQFFVAMRPLPFLDDRRVAFARVVSGMRVLRRVGALETENDRPVTPCVVVQCGEYVPGGRVPPCVNALSREQAEAAVRRENRTTGVGTLDLRRKKTKRRYMDLRRPKTKGKLLREVFEQVDSSGDGVVQRGELLAALRDPNSLLTQMFPTHTAEIPYLFDKWDVDGSGDISWDEFKAGAMEALAAPGGRS